MESSAKIGNFFIGGSQEHIFLGQKHKSAICDRTPPHLHIKPSLYVSRRVQGSQIFKQNWIISICSRVIVILVIWVSFALGGGAGGWGILGWSALVYMSSGMFRGKESSNRIELSWLVQELLNFGFLGSLRLWGWGVWVDAGGGWLGGAPHTCAHAHTCMHAHACVVNMIISCKCPPWEFPMMSYVHVCACLCTWVGCTLSPPPTPFNPPPTPQGWTPRIIQNSIALELIEIFQFRLKIWNLWRLLHPWVGV